ncbi:hypothetical protein [uncultured Roseibium sp.]|uniref:hypothetical protein n=1 Tax=uncultured Roseibium sp. TaxID=1936171 RepID=UPI002625F820|nr:hypothetical protein [uncultured Roseibium sp.]
MLRDKRIDLDSVKRKKLIERLLQEISRSQGDLYYQSTSTIALQIKEYVKGDAKLNAEEKALLEPLSQRDIEVLLSLH